jgi:hypothetical protein
MNMGVDPGYKTLLGWASYYHKLGWCIIPIPYGRKTPEMKWKVYQNERPSKSLLAEWFRNTNQRNIAVVLGQVSGGLACRDFDTRSGYQIWAKKHEKLAGILPTVHTPHGYHVYFQGESK